MQILMVTIIVESQSCDIDRSVTVQEGEVTNIACQLNFTGDDYAFPTWRVMWSHGSRQLASVNQDTTATVRRVVSFRATRDDSGEYLCEITSTTRPTFKASCVTTVKVQGESIFVYYKRSINNTMFTVKTIQRQRKLTRLIKLKKARWVIIEGFAMQISHTCEWVLDVMSATEMVSFPRYFGVKNATECGVFKQYLCKFIEFKHILPSLV